MQQSLDIALKGVKYVSIYNILRYGVLRNFFCRIGISILMSVAYLLHLMYYGGDVRHIELHGVGSFLVCVAV